MDFQFFFGILIHVRLSDMIKSKETKNKGIEIDLTGPQGNAFTF